MPDFPGKVTPGFSAEYVSPMAARVSVREAAAKTMSSTGSAAAPEEAAAEDAAALEAELPQAVRAAAVVRPAAHKKFRREILFRSHTWSVIYHFTLSSFNAFNYFLYFIFSI